MADCNEILGVKGLKDIIIFEWRDIHKVKWDVHSCDVFLLESYWQCLPEAESSFSVGEGRNFERFM